MRAERTGSRQFRQALLGCAATGSVLAASVVSASPPGGQTTPAPPPGATLETAGPPKWPEPARAPAGAPNVLIIMTDDVGFGSTSTFGGPVPTTTFDALAREGLRYNRFHTTAICSPTRASLLTGRNPQDVGVGYVTNWSSGFDGYNSMIPKSAGTLPQVLRANGYDTAMFGKGHITPEWEQGPNGPFDRWPTGLGFDYFYGFLGADTSAFQPSLIENTRPSLKPREPDYHLDRDLADHAIDWIAEQRATTPDRPFFIYLAPGTAHAPNHAPREWLERFRGKFDGGWDKLREEIVSRQRKLGVIPPGTQDAPRPETLPRWADLSLERQRLYARYMEAYAASLAYADHEIGRVIASLRDSGEIDNTMIVYIQGDNGASAEGSFDGKLFEQSALAGVKEDPAYAEKHIDDIGTERAYNLNTGGWGWAMNAPFPWAKRYGSHLGGTRNGMVISWKGHIADRGGLRSQYLHVSDIMPTVLEAAGIAAPEQLNGVRQKPVTGISAAYTLKSRTAPSRRTSQIFAMSENLAIYRDGWMASSKPKVTPWDAVPPAPVKLADRSWELYNLDRDFSQSRDVAKDYPERLSSLVGEFWNEARNGQIFPIHSTDGQQKGRPDPNRDRRQFVYTRPVTQVAEAAAPHIVGRSFTIEADLVAGEATNGVLVAHGGRFSGYSLFMDKGRPVFTYNLTPAHLTRIEATAPLMPGPHRIALTFAMDEEKGRSPATVRIMVDGKEVASGRVPQTFALVVSHSEGFDVGADNVSAVDPGYETENSRFSGVLNRLVFLLSN
ncbi:MAG: sulfatase-like hydrolase/transferase [Novosphingobium sp.]|nr:sulfatase-like hydrolase/transferase [Novosphingobium sp.]